VVVKFKNRFESVPKTTELSMSLLFVEKTVSDG